MGRNVQTVLYKNKGLRVALYARAWVEMPVYPGGQPGAADVALYARAWVEMDIL